MLKLLAGLAIVFLSSLEYAPVTEAPPPAAVVAEKPDKAPPPPPEEDSLSATCPGFNCAANCHPCQGWLQCGLCTQCHCYF